MKKTRFIYQRFGLAVLLAAALGGSALAQKKTERGQELRLRIVERTGNEVRELERTYQIDELTDEKRDALIKQYVDSLRSARRGPDGRKSQLTITIDDDRSTDSRVTYRERRNGQPHGGYSYEFRGPGAPERWSFGFSDDDTLRNRDRRNRDRDWEFRVRRSQLDSLADRIDRMSGRIPRDVERHIVRPFEAWARDANNKPASVRGLDVYPNNPDRNLLNVRFTAPAKGDVLITVTNPRGNVVAKKEVKDFSGEYVGQIDLGRKAQGTFFVTVTQNDDGAVRRVVIPAE